MEVRRLQALAHESTRQARTPSGERTLAQARARPGVPFRQVGEVALRAYQSRTGEQARRFLRRWTPPIRSWAEASGLEALL